MTGNTKFGKFISTIAYTDVVGLFEMLIYSFFLTVLCLASASDVVVVSGATDRTGLMIYKVLKRTERECPRLLSERHEARERLV